MIFPIWQPIGSSSHLLTQAVGKEMGEKATHTGTLDPMAEGVLVILTGEDRFAKGLLHDWLKTYCFSILWGIATDTADKLGCITEYSTQRVAQEILIKVLKNFPHSYMQKIPDFSARRIDGQSSFDWAKQKKHILEKKRGVEISTISYDAKETIDRNSLLFQHETAIGQVSGEFRQEAVIKSWNEKIPHEITTFLITEHTVTTSAGTYIRQLVSDISKQLAIPATTWAIKRISNGPFTIDDCS